MDNSKLALTLEQAADLINVSLPTMREIVHKADFPAFRMGRRWIIPVDTFNEWICQRAKERSEL